MLEVAKLLIKVQPVVVSSDEKQPLLFEILEIEQVVSLLSKAMEVLVKQLK